MKRVLTIASVLCLTWLGVSAQNMYDGINYSENNYVGTARSAALGNAMTAVGGDLGSIGINPAGAAVAGYSTFTITPGISITSTGASYAPEAYGNVTEHSTMSQSRFHLPNMGVTINFDTGQKYGVRNVTVGFLSNMTNIYSDKMSITGTNSNTSMMGEAAYYVSKNKINCNALASDNAYNAGYKWTDVLSYKSGFIAPFGGSDVDYVGANEVIYNDNTIGLGGPIDQSYFRRHTGSKSDLIINTAINYSDKLYVGVNLGVPSLKFAETLNMSEAAVNKADFPLILDDVDTHWINGRQRYTLETSGTGLYAKLGAIWLPFEGLRLGAAVQTPTIYSVTERWMWDQVCNFDGFDSQQYETPVGEYTYNLVTPFSFNLGAAYTLGDFAMVSADWERVDYKTMSFQEEDSSFGNDEFYDLNQEIYNYAGVTDHLRFGLEIRPTESFALRAGYARKQYKEAEFTDVTSAFSAGLGYASSGSFFWDCAVRFNKYPTTWFYPYEDYLFEDVGIKSPEVNVVKKSVDLVFTFGWRF